MKSKLNDIMRELEKKLIAGGGYAEITAKKSGRKLYIYEQDSGYAVYFTDGNIWTNTTEENAEHVFFPFVDQGLKELAKYIQMM